MSRQRDFTNLRRALVGATALLVFLAVNSTRLLAQGKEADFRLTLQKKDPNRDVRANAGFALERDDKADAEAIRKALADYDPKKMATAKLGEKAPDFSLVGADKKKVRLSDYKGKKAVVLVFIYGDT